MTKQDGSSVSRAAGISGEMKALAESELSRSSPVEIPAIIHELAETVDSLKQVAAQLSWWHSRAIHSSYYAAEEGAGLAIEDAAAQLLAASRFLSASRDAITAAETATSAIRWKRHRPDTESPIE